MRYLADRSDSAAATRVETVTFDSKRYWIERTAGYGGPGTFVERWLGIGVVGGIRAWRGHSWAESVRWYAAVNPTGEPFQATARGRVHVAVGRGPVAARERRRGRRSAVVIGLFLKLAPHVLAVEAVAAPGQRHRRPQPAGLHPLRHDAAADAEPRSDLGGGHQARFDGHRITVCTSMPWPGC